MSDRPNGWAGTTLGEIASSEVNQGGPDPDRGTFTYVDIGSIDRAAKRIAFPQVLDTTQAPSRARQNLQPGDVLVSMTRPNLNAVAMVPKELDGSIGSTGFHVLRTRYVSASWLAYRVQATDFVSAMSARVQGALYPAIRPSDVDGFSLSLAPLTEQDRIVAEIEKQFTRLDAATAALRRVHANLKRYRASVLKAACEGRLVPREGELARKEGREYEPADELLKRILQERRARWEADTLAKMSASGKPPKDDSWKRKYKEPFAPDTTDLPPLPEGWCWMTLDMVLFGITAGRSFKCDERPPEIDEYGIVKVSAVTWGRFDELESKTCLPGSPLVKEFEIHRGDFLFSRANTIELVGACVIVGDVSRRLMLSDKILRFDCASETLKHWLLILLRSEWGRSEIERLATGNQESMRNIGQERIRAIRIPLAPKLEMERATVSTKTADELEQRMRLSAELQAQRARHVRQGILQQAFSGKLLSQDPSDEPASIVLDRIRTEHGLSTTQKAKDVDNSRVKRKQMTQNKAKPQKTIIEALSEANLPLTPENLFSSTGRQPEAIEEFYQELKTEVSSGRVEELRTGTSGIVLRVKQA